MSTQKILQEVDIKFGEILDMLPEYQVYPTMLKILLGMLVETRQYNDYLKIRIEKLEHNKGEDTCQH